MLKTTDTMFGLAIKEMGCVPELMKLHPMMTMLGGSEMKLQNTVKITTQSRIAVNSWLGYKRNKCKQNGVKKCA